MWEWVNFIILLIYGLIYIFMLNICINYDINKFYNFDWFILKYWIEIFYKKYNEKKMFYYFYFLLLVIYNVGVYCRMILIYAFMF